MSPSTYVMLEFIIVPTTKYPQAVKGLLPSVDGKNDSIGYNSNTEASEDLTIFINPLSFNDP
tara:strand:- start:7292 stop:7477 length:186 start_codon:yes stop_codon:yes gene_type:complete